MGVIWVADAICEDQRDNARNAEESRDNILIILISHQYTVTNNSLHLPALASKIVYTTYYTCGPAIACTEHFSMTSKPSENI